MNEQKSNLRKADDVAVLALGMFVAQMEARDKRCEQPPKDSDE